MPSGAGYLRKPIKRSEVYSNSSAAFNLINQRYLNNMSTISNWPPMQKKIDEPRREAGGIPKAPNLPSGAEFLRKPKSSHTALRS